MKPLLSLLCIAVTFAIAGCNDGPGDMPDVGAVTGLVTLDGEPVEGANILFYPVEGGRSSTAISDAGGAYALIYKGSTLGAKVGEHQISLSTVQEESGTAGDPDYQPAREEVIPEKYRADSELRFTVEPGENTFDISLES